MKILNFGSLNIDKVYKVHHFVRPGETISSEIYTCFPGGKGLNQSIAIARAGEKVFHAGTLGKDGDFLKTTLEESGVYTDYLRISLGINGHALIQVTEEGENSIILFKGSNYENDNVYINDVFSHFDKDDILVLQNEVNNLDYLIEHGKEKGMKILLNASPIDEKLKQLDLSCITWLMINETEGMELTGETEPDFILKRLIEKYPDMQIVLTLGTKGSIFKSKEETIFQPCIKTKTIDTTAAGDTFTGYFIASVVKGKTIKTALKTAAQAASLAVSREGAAVSIPKEQEVEQYILLV